MVAKDIYLLTYFVCFYRNIRRPPLMFQGSSNGWTAETLVPTWRATLERDPPSTLFRRRSAGFERREQTVTGRITKCCTTVEKIYRVVFPNNRQTVNMQYSSIIVKILLLMGVYILHQVFNWRLASWNQIQRTKILCPEYFITFKSSKYFYVSHPVLTLLKKIWCSG